MTKEEVLRAYPYIPSDAALGDFLFFMGRPALLGRALGYRR
jgi:hypothetical protein